MYKIKYLVHYNPQINGSKGKHWRKLGGSYATIENATEAFNEFSGWFTRQYANDHIIGYRIMDGKEIVADEH